MNTGHTPVTRLALSRERLRLAMSNAPPPVRAANGHHATGSAEWLQALKSSPGASVLFETVSRWWAQHPLRLVGMVAADAANATLKTTAQRHPLGLVLTALLVGGALAWSRPWRWILTPALFAGLLPQLFSKAMTLIPAGSWMAVLTSLAQEQAPSFRRPETTPAPSSPQPAGGPDERGGTAVQAPSS